MNALLLNILLLLNLGTVFGAPYKFSISGTIEGLESGVISILSTDNKELLTAQIENGTYKLNGKLKEAGQYLISVNGYKHYCFLDGKEMIFSGKYGAMKPGDLKGSPSNDLYEAYYKMIANQLGNAINAELAVYRAALAAKDSIEADISINKILQLEEQRYPITKAFIKEHRSNIFAAYIADVVIDASYENGKELYSILTPKVQQSYLGKGLKVSMESLRISAIGALSPDFTVKNEAGATFKLSSQFGKILVLDFWASWCGPCIQEMKALKKMYKTLDSDKIEFISISFDDDADKWKQACEAEQIPWISAHEEKGWKASEIRKQYGIRSIPFIVIIDAEGKIVAKNLRRNSLHEKLTELLNQ